MRHFSIIQLTKQWKLFRLTVTSINQFERQVAEEKGRREGKEKKHLTYSYMGIY
jgi:hypothetical protein